MIDNTTLILNTFLVSRTQVIRNLNVIVDIDLSELFEMEIPMLQFLIDSNLSAFKDNSLLILTEEEVPVTGARYAMTHAGIFILAGLIKSKKAIRIYVKLVEILVTNLQDRAYEIATSYQPDKVW